MGLPDHEMLEALRRLWARHGDLSQAIINADKSTPHTSAYHLRFGSVSRAYELIGYVPNPKQVRPARVGRRLPDSVLLDGLRKVLQERGQLSKKIIRESRSIPCSGTYERRFRSLAKAYRLIGYTAPRRGERIKRPLGLSDDEMLEALRRLWREHGYLSERLVLRSTDLPSRDQYRKRFGRLRSAFKKLGYNVTRGGPKGRKPHIKIDPH